MRPNLWAVVLLVLIAHGLVGVYIVWDREPAALLSKPPAHQVLVKTISLAETPPAPVIMSSPVVVQQPKLEKKKKSVAKVEKPVAKKSGPSAERVAAVAKAKASLAQLQEGKGSTASPQQAQVDLVVPVLSEVPVFAPAKVDSSYADELVSRLKVMLKLPEYGQVKVQLTLERSGKVAKVDILQAESEVNRRYVERYLPDCKFAGFGRHFGDDAQHLFVLVLSNDL